MRVSINFSILPDLGRNEEIITSLQKNALKAWEKRPQGATSVQIIQELPTKNFGRHFRFYRVTPHKDDRNCLVVR